MQTTQYKFKTKAEAEAFIEGVALVPDDAITWGGPTDIFRRKYRTIPVSNALLGESEGWYVLIHDAGADG